MDQSSGPRFREELNLADYFLFDRLKEGRGDQVAIRWGQREYRYAEVAARTRALSRALGAAGVERGARVYIVLPDTPPFAWSFFATLAAGGVVTMGNPDAPPDDLAGVIDYVEPVVLITVPRVLAQLARRLGRRTSVREVLLVPDVATGDDPEVAPERRPGIPETGDAPDPVDPIGPEAAALAVRTLADCANGAPLSQAEWERTRPRLHRDDHAIWLFTSGSTGRPKAAMHTHRDFAYNTEVYAKGTVGYRAGDVSVSVPRLFFGYATGTNLMFPFAVGATVGLFAERPTPESLAAAIAAYRPTIVTNVPTMLGKLLDHDDELAAAGRPRLDFSSIRFHLSAGEALPPALLERFTARFDNPIYDGIGSAEMFHIYASNRPGDVKPGSLGRVVDGYRIRVLPEEAQGPGAPPLPAGEIGVMWVEGDSVALGYHRDRDRSWQTFHGRACRTGDLFRLDDDGYLWFSGRADDLLKVSGLWVAPLEVEACLMEHPAVTLAAVIAGDEAGLIKPKALVVVRESQRDTVRSEAGRRALADELREHVKTRLARHKYPRWIVFVDDLPKNDRGKVDKKLLREREQRGELGGE